MATVITVTITFLVTTILNFALSTIKKYNNKENVEHEAILCLLRSNITSKCVVYMEMGNVPQQEKENVNMMFDVYKNKMDGNSYVEDMVNKFNKLPIK